MALAVSVTPEWEVAVSLPRPLDLIRPDERVGGARPFTLDLAHALEDPRSRDVELRIGTEIERLLIISWSSSWGCRWLDIGEGVASEAARPLLVSIECVKVVLVERDRVEVLRLGQQRESDQLLELLAIALAEVMHELHDHTVALSVAL